MTPTLAPLHVILAQPRGFCAGVERAIDIVERTLSRHGAPVYVRHEIVHNTHVVARLRARGAVFVEDVGEIPEGAVTIFSAHGVSRAVERDAAARRLDVIDATCPLVRRVQVEAQRHAAQGFDVVLIGHRGHPEVDGTRGQVDGPVHVVATPDEVATLQVTNPGRVAYVTQTTLSMTDTREVIAALTKRFPSIRGPDIRDICYATQNRQNAVAELAKRAQFILVMGSPNSSNSNRLRELGESFGVQSRLIDDADAIERGWFDGVDVLGLTAGASAPEMVVQEAIERLKGFRRVSIETLDGVAETMAFRLPRRLAENDARAAQGSM